MDGFRCIPCRSGFYSEAGARECTACAAGTVSVPTYLPATAADNKPYSQYKWLYENATACKPCPAGYFQPNLAGTVCIPCPSGELLAQPRLFRSWRGIIICISSLKASSDRFRLDRWRYVMLAVPGGNLSRRQRHRFSQHLGHLWHHDRGGDG